MTSGCSISTFDRVSLDLYASSQKCQTDVESQLCSGSPSFDSGSTGTSLGLPGPDSRTTGRGILASSIIYNRDLVTT